jgi:RHS repeat-associated protein
MVSQITQGTTVLGFTYNTDHQRLKQCIGGCTSSTTTVLYLNDPVTSSGSEKSTSGSTVIWKDYIVADGGIVAERTNTIGVIGMQYFVLDHLGSTAALTDTAGNTLEQDYYDAWGKRRNANGSADTTCSLTSTTTRGFSGHEMLDSVCLTNMNARVYDQYMGRFLSADGMMQGAGDGQNLNRYSYVNNRPTSLRDPTGHFANRLGDVPGSDGTIDPVDGGSAGPVEDVTDSDINTWNTPGGEVISVTCDASCQGAIMRQQGPSFANTHGNGGGTSNGGGGSSSGPGNGNPCDALLPNGQTVGDVIRLERSNLLTEQQLAQDAAMRSDGGGTGFVTGYFLGIASPNGPIDFKSNFAGQANSSFLGQAGNFAYYSIGSGILPDVELDAGAGAYAVTSALSGQKSFSKLTGPMFSDSSAASVRAAGLASRGCPK